MIHWWGIAQKLITTTLFLVFSSIMLAILLCFWREEIANWYEKYYNILPWMFVLNIHIEKLNWQIQFLSKSNHDILAILFEEMCPPNPKVWIWDMTSCAQWSFSVMAESIIIQLIQQPVVLKVIKLLWYFLRNYLTVIRTGCYSCFDLLFSYLWYKESAESKVSQVAFNFYYI